MKTSFFLSLKRIASFKCCVSPVVAGGEGIKGKEVQYLQDQIGEGSFRGVTSL